MSRLSLRSAVTALALGIAALGGTTLMPGEASAKGFTAAAGASIITAAAGTAAGVTATGGRSS
jgi:hypothetical protein